MSDQTESLSLSFETSDEAYDHIDKNYPRHQLVFMEKHSDGTVTAYLDPPEAGDFCEFCNEDPCVMVVHQDDFQGLVTLHGCNDLLDNCQRRFKLYREMTRLVNGYLGKTVRKELPKCVTDPIREHFPNDSQVPYVGFREANNNSS